MELGIALLLLIGYVLSVGLAAGIALGLPYLLVKGLDRLNLRTEV